MAPVRQRDPSVERTEEYEEFMKKLEEYHQKRGTQLEREPKVGPRHLDLLRLYKRVVEEGGYDKVSDTKNNKLAWRKITSEFFPWSNAVTTQAFIVKSAYYKNLAAYEITHIHKKEPPPKEILEDLTAKGGDLLNRTVENYFPRMNRETENLINGKDAYDSDTEQKTPGNDKMDIDEPTSAGRMTRALRHAPPQRVLFQPDVSSSRQGRQSTTGVNSPAPTSVNGIYSGSGTSMTTIANYEPRQQVPSAVKPVVTPGNNLNYYKDKASRMLAAKRLGRPIAPRGMMLPGTGFTGPNIYIRAQLALQSSIVEEQAYALHHLVKISHERGDKYRFDGFPGLAEALIDKGLQVASLFWDIKLRISYDDVENHEEPHVLNGVQGTRNLLQNIQNFPLRDTYDDIQTEEFAAEMGRINEAGLVLRNMVMMEENAQYLSRLPVIRDFITVALNLPPRTATIELKHQALEIAEQLTKYFVLGATDPLYQSLLNQLYCDDRGAIITALRALGRISMNLEVNNRLENVPDKLLQRIHDWLLIDDEELRNGCLDFLYQFTASVDNVELLLRSVHIDSLINQLVRLLLHNAPTTETKERSRAVTKGGPSPETAPKLSIAIIEQFLEYSEPERSQQWLRTCFEDDPSGEITQIALWQAYNDCFKHALETRPNISPLMPAKDFITNVSTTFPGATAQVLNTGTTHKYTIRGIRPRAIPVDLRGRPYIRCDWHVEPLTGRACGEFAKSPAEMWDHIVLAHLQIPRNEHGRFDPSAPGPPDRRYTCNWGGCGRFSALGEESPHHVAAHIKTHLPDSTPLAAHRLKHNRTASPTTDLRNPYGLNNAKVWMNTQTDERNDAAGLPLASVLVLRNIARQMAKLESEDGGWVARTFGTVKEQLYFVMAHNLSLREYITSLTRAIAAAGG